MKLGNMDSHVVKGSHFSFSGTKISSLGAAEYTIVTIVMDETGSVSAFKDQLESVLKEVVSSCRKSPRADNLMIRVVRFNTSVNEIHGFKLLSDINEKDYNDSLEPEGMTALFDATYTSIEALVHYGKTLVDNDFSVNAALFVVTDGDNNAGTATAKMVAEAIKKARNSEVLESIMPVLIGVNTDDSTGLNQFLEAFKRDADFQQYVEIKKADAKTLAKLGGFISKSISSQSQALGSGGPSKSLTF